jgi:putative YphP/YqiW family bacilliredoxin
MTWSDMPSYDPVAVQPMREELVAVGFKELLDPAAVDEALARREGSTLVVINSVCGCAAGNVRPGVALALQNARIPDRLVTVFAGMEKLAVKRVREHLGPQPPSSPFLALFQGGELVWSMPRAQLESRTALDVATALVAAFDAHASRPGPSIPREEFEKLGFTATCGCSL